MKTENKVMVEIGSVVPCITPGGKIASWLRNDGSIFCKISMEITTSPRWVAVDNPIYRSKGLIVFLDRKPATEEAVEIIRVGKNYAIGRVVKE